MSSISKKRTSSTYTPSIHSKRRRTRSWRRTRTLPSKPFITILIDMHSRVFPSYETDRFKKGVYYFHEVPLKHTLSVGYKPNYKFPRLVRAYKQVISQVEAKLSKEEKYTDVQINNAALKYFWKGRSLYKQANVITYYIRKYYYQRLCRLILGQLKDRIDSFKNKLFISRQTLRAIDEDELVINKYKNLSQDTQVLEEYYKELSEYAEKTGLYIPEEKKEQIDKDFKNHLDTVPSRIDPMDRNLNGRYKQLLFNKLFYIKNMEERQEYGRIWVYIINITKEWKDSIL